MPPAEAALKSWATLLSIGIRAPPLPPRETLGSYYSFFFFNIHTLYLIIQSKYFSGWEVDINMLRCQQLEMLSLSATGSLMSCQPRLRAVFSQIDLTDDYCDNDDKVNDVLEKGLFIRKIMSLAIRPCPLRAAHSLTELRKAIHALSEHLAAEFAYGKLFYIIFKRILK